MKTRIAILSFCAAIPFLLAADPATQPAPPRAARSIHLSYSTKPAIAFYNEVTVRQSVPGSFFQCCGFTHGYFGMQDLSDHKIVIFSLWDPPCGDNASAVPEEKRVEVVYQGEGVTIKRFGGEGTGAQSRIDFDWKIGQTYRYLLTAKVEDQKTQYAAWLFMPKDNAWKHLATFRVTTGGDELSGLYSFIEDFRRNGESATETRRAEFGNGWTKDLSGQWHPLLKATFTASDAPFEARDSVDAGIVNGSFYLQTGANTQKTRAIDSKIERPATDAKPPELPKP